MNSALWPLITVVAATLASGVAAWLVAWLVMRVASRRSHLTAERAAADRATVAAERAAADGATTADRATAADGVTAADGASTANAVTTAVLMCRRAVVTTVMAVAAAVTVQSVPHVATGWQRATTIAVIGSACWLIVRLLQVVERILFRRLRVDVADNRRVRRARTQVTLIRRVSAAVVVTLGIAAALMTFPGLRTFGASLLASAGLAGILAGLAAQTTLGNVFAGLQLAFTDAVRIDDVVVVEQEWGRIEEITLTYVVVHIWDERRMVLPTSYFTTTPFQNWTRTQARVLGSVILYLDYATPLTPLREKAKEVIEASELWDRQAWVLQVTDTTETTMVVRVLASAADGPTAWDLRCDIREALLAYLQEHHPQSLPAHRIIGGAEPVTATVRPRTLPEGEGEHLDFRPGSRAVPAPGGPRDEPRYVEHVEPHAEADIRPGPRDVRTGQA